MLTIAPPPLSRMQRRRGLRAQKRSGEIDRQHPRPVLVGDVEDRLEDGDAGIVDQRIEPAEAVLHRGDGLLDAGRVGDIAGDGERHVRLADRGHRLLQIVAVDVEQRHAPALGEKALGGGKPDAARGAGDEGGFDRAAGSCGRASVGERGAGQHDGGARCKATHVRLPAHDTPFALAMLVMLAAHGARGRAGRARARSVHRRKGHGAAHRLPAKQCRVSASRRWRSKSATARPRSSLGARPTRNRELAAQKAELAALKVALAKLEQELAELKKPKLEKK